MAFGIFAGSTVKVNVCSCSFRNLTVTICPANTNWLPFQGLFSSFSREVDSTTHVPPSFFASSVPGCAVATATTAHASTSTTNHLGDSMQGSSATGIEQRLLWPNNELTCPAGIPTSLHRAKANIGKQ